MMERHEHTDPWADKLQEVPLPDANDSWNAMAALLDKEMPLARRQARRRWLLLILLLLLLIGVCNCPRLGNRHQGAGPGPGLKTAAIPDSATFTPGAPASRVPATGASASRGSAAVPADTGEITSPDSQPSRKPGKGNSGTAGNMRSGGAGNMRSGSVGDIRSGSASGQRSGTVDNQRYGNTGNKTPATSGLKAGEPTDPMAATEVPQGPAVKKPADPGKKPTDRVAQKPTKQPDKKKTEKDKPTEEDDVKGLVAGVGLNQFFSVGQQQKSDYNSGATSGGIGDYIPVPMVRYYFSRKLYIQLEAQFNTPQYTKKDLVGGQSKADTLSPGRVEQNSVIIKKLFYFNLPLSIHYSPIKNLYLGAGLQYSRLSNGVGVLQNRVIMTGAADSIKSAVVYNIKGDSVYQKMRTNEFRVLFDINYTYKRFILGVRYNQALSKFLDVRISDTQITQARNSSLQLYARYILWDHRKKKSSPSK